MQSEPTVFVSRKSRKEVRLWPTMQQSDRTRPNVSPVLVGFAEDLCIWWWHIDKVNTRQILLNARAIECAYNDMVLWERLFCSQLTSWSSIWATWIKTRMLATCVL